MALTTEDQIKALSIITVLICLKFFFVIIGSGGKRKRAPEDGFQPKAATQAMNDNDNDNAQPGFSEEERWKRIVQNDMENIPITLTLMWIAVICEGNEETNVAFGTIFLFGRVMHTICYIYSLMPWRSLAWLLGILSTLGFMGNIVYGAFK